MLVLAQRPKMYIKLYGGINASSLVYKIDNVDSDILAGFQLGGGVRVNKRHAFAEVDFTYIVEGITFSPVEGDDLPVEDDVTILMRSLDIPLVIGYIPVKTPLFGTYLYGGISNRFSLKGEVDYMGEEYKFKPKEANLHFYNLGLRMGVQIDLAMFNFDLNYTFGVTNHFKEKVRTNHHTLMFNIGVLF